MDPRYSPLFETVAFPNGLRLRNRIAVAPMTHYSSNDDGSTADEELPYVRRRSKSVGLFITACYAVTENGKERSPAARSSWAEARSSGRTRPWRRS
jgi:2,4-dienoyl-CoA reductase-like NADH-dependent reductase (Old Yellow Enzyme family)